MTTERHKRYMARKRAERIAKCDGSVRIWRFDYREPGERSLLIATIDQAMLDYFAAVKSGKVSQARLTSKATSVEAVLVKFFTGGDCSSMFSLAGLDVSPQEIKAALIRLEADDTWAAYYGQGVNAWKIAKQAQERIKDNEQQND